MGKYERGKIEEAENLIVKILNNKNINNKDKENPWFNHVLAIAKKIKKDFTNIDKVFHLGNRYNNTGDILIISNKKKFFIEIKMSLTEKGIGTKANISQDALTLNKLFRVKVQSWSEFRRKLRHDEWVNNFLNKFKNYPKNILKINNFSIQKEEKARYLRKIKKINVKAKEILNLIHQKDKEEKKLYLNYLAKKKQDEKMIKRFSALILLGVHKQKTLKKLLKSKILFEEIKNLFIYYSNLSKNKVIVKRENLGEKIKILNKFSHLKITFPKNVTYCKIVGIKGNQEVPILQVVFHWKNIAQGIKTPCLNIFDLSK